MMPKRILGLLVLIALLTTDRFAFAQEFSAIQVSRDTPGHVVKSKMYMSGKKVSSYPIEDNGQFWGLVDLAQHTSTLISVGKRSYTQRPMALVELWGYALVASPCPPAMLKELGQGATCKDLGSETLNGRRTEKWEISQRLQGQTLLTRIWVDTKLLVWIKTEAVMDGATLGGWELQDLQEGPQPASLFVIPAGFRDAPLFDPKF